MNPEMGDAAHGTAEALERAAAGLLEAVAGASPGWLALAVALHLANQLARGMGWLAILTMAGCGDRPPRARDAVATWVAGAGMGGVLSARGGDAVRVLLIRRRLPDAGCPMLAGTLVAEAAGEAALGAATAGLLLAVGTGAGVSLESDTVAWIALALLVALPVGVVLRARSRRMRRLLAGVGKGCAPLGEPRAYARAVLPWQLASRLLRVASLLCFLAAFHLPATVAAVALVMAAQGGGRMLPLAPASLAASVAVLAAGFPQATGVDVGVGALAGFLVGMSTLLTLAGVLLAVPIALWMCGARPMVAALKLRFQATRA
jgi:Lysylphosphatidylglycerol synthase TM region